MIMGPEEASLLDTDRINPGEEFPHLDGFRENDLRT